MKQCNIFRLLLLFGVLSSIFSGCEKEISDGVQYGEYIYKNTTSHSLELTGYSNMFGPAGAVKTWSIAPTGALTFEFEYIMGGISPAPIFSDSVRLLFDGHRELWYRRGDLQPGNILVPGVEREISKNRTKYTHEITEVYYDRSIEIAI